MFLAVAGWILYARLICPASHAGARPAFEPGLQNGVETTGDIRMWPAAGIVGAGCMVGVVIR